MKSVFDAHKNDEFAKKVQTITLFKSATNK